MREVWLGLFTGAHATRSPDCRNHPWTVPGKEVAVDQNQRVGRFLTCTGIQNRAALWEAQAFVAHWGSCTQLEAFSSNSPLVRGINGVGKIWTCQLFLFFNQCNWGIVYIQLVLLYIQFNYFDKYMSPCLFKNQIPFPQKFLLCTFVENTWHLTR